MGNNVIATSHRPSASVEMKPATIQPAWVRIAHWLNALAVLLLVTSGWRIYNASPIFNFRFPKELVLGGWLGGALLWHFAAMWLLAVNAIVYLILNVLSRRLQRRFFPLTPREFLADVGAALRGHLAHEDLAHYNAVQKAAYLGAWALLLLLVLSGLVVWKSVQFPLLRELMGGYDNARVIHFFAMAALVFFSAVHIFMVAVVPKTLRVMILGR